MSSRYRGGSALVTGASSGVGEAFARALAAEGADVLLTALPAERDGLERIASELAAAHGVRTVVVPMDLATRDGPRSLVDEADRLGFEPSILVNSAGFGDVGAFVEQSLERQLAMIRLNVLALVAITGAYVPRMIRQRDGVVVNIASTAAFHPLPYLAVYAAGKSFVLAFGEALWAETRAAGVHTVTVCSGPVDTPFIRGSWGTDDATAVKRQIRRRYLTPQAVVDAAFAAVEADRPRAVVRLRGGGVVTTLTAIATIFVPRRWRVLATERINRWLYHST